MYLNAMHRKCIPVGAMMSAAHALYSLGSKLRPGKVDSLFPISHFLNFDAGGRSLFIIHYDITIIIFNFTMYIKIFFT